MTDGTDRLFVKSVFSTVIPSIALLIGLLFYQPICGDLIGAPKNVCDLIFLMLGVVFFLFLALDTFLFVKMIIERINKIKN
jgi:hypothetical protein